MTKGVLSLVALIILTGCAKNSLTSYSELTPLPESQEAAMGREADPEIAHYFGLYENQELLQLISEKGHEMAAISHGSDLKYEFKVIDSPVINAFAVPGYIYLTRGILAYFNSEAELAAIVGHELGHIVARQHYKNAMTANGLMKNTGLSKDLGEFTEDSPQELALFLLGFSPEAETQADNLGVEYASRINYDARELAGFFWTLEQVKQQSRADELPDFLSTHPNPDNRTGRVTRFAAEWKKKIRGNHWVNHERYLRMIDGNDPQHGFTDDNVFYHPVLKFELPYPSLWTVRNGRGQIQFSSTNGRAVMLLTAAEGSSLESAAEKFVQDYELNVHESRYDSINGERALVMIGDREGDPEQQAVRMLFYIIEHDNSYHAMVGASLRDDFSDYAAEFKNSFDGFRTLTDFDKLERQPELIHVKPVLNHGTLEAALRSYNTPPNRLEEVATLNGMMLNEIVRKGMLIKTVSMRNASPFEAPSARGRREQ